MHKLYVVGFAFSQTGGNILLIKKAKPEWQAGKLNGIGGKVEPFEKFDAAMVREFFEETGVSTDVSDWTRLGKLEGTDWTGTDTYTVEVFFMFNDVIFSAHTTTQEEIFRIPTTNLSDYHVISNLLWMIPMAINAHHEQGMCGLKSFEAHYS